MGAGPSIAFGRASAALPNRNVHSLKGTAKMSDALEMLLDAARFIERDKPQWAKAARAAVAQTRAGTQEPVAPASAEMQVAVDALNTLPLAERHKLVLTQQTVAAWDKHYRDGFDAGKAAAPAAHGATREAELERVLRECARLIDSGGDPTALSRDVLTKLIYRTLTPSHEAGTRDAITDLSVDAIRKALGSPGWWRKDIPRPPNRKDGLPTRIDRQWLTLAELAINNAMREIECAGASAALTEAAMLLAEARDAVADHVEGNETKRAARETPEQRLDLDMQLFNNARSEAIEECAAKAGTHQQESEVQVLNAIRDALEIRGYFHMANGRDIGILLDAIPAGTQEPVAYTNEAQLGFLKDPAYADIPMAMWGNPWKSGNIALYAAPASHGATREEKK